MAQSKVKQILLFWFGDLNRGDVDMATKQRWFKKDPDFDQEIKKRFTTNVQAASMGEYDAWQVQASGSLALLILLDQFTRNIYRNNAQAWACDTKAQHIALDALEFKQDQDLLPIQRVFLYMPLMHAEDLSLQTRCVDLFRQLVQDTTVDGESPYQMNLDYAIEHAEIIERFGRFPHRNKLLGRETTAEEAAFLEENPGF